MDIIKTLELIGFYKIYNNRKLSYKFSTLNYKYGISIIEIRSAILLTIYTQNIKNNFLTKDVYFINDSNAIQKAEDFLNSEFKHIIRKNKISKIL